MKNPTLLVLAGLSLSSVAFAGEPKRTVIDFNDVIIGVENRGEGGCGGLLPARYPFESLIEVRGSFTPELLATAPLFEGPALDDLIRVPLRQRVTPGGDILDPLAHRILATKDGLHAALNAAPSSNAFISRMLESSRPAGPACGGAETPPCAPLKPDRFERFVDDVVIIHTDCVHILE